MYQPAHFVEDRIEAMHALMHAHPLATLITLNAAGELQADPVPLLVEPGPTPAGVLRGHVARANPLWHETRADVDVLVVFQGPQAYVSPAWYASKAEHGKVVPTWNYMVVQARGRLRAIEDATWLRGLVGRLTERFEQPLAAADRPAWQVDDAPAAYIDTMLKAIVGIEIPIDALAGKWKVSQNRSAADRRGVAAGLALVAAQSDNDTRRESLVAGPAR